MSKRIYLIKKYFVNEIYNVRAFIFNETECNHPLEKFIHFKQLF